MSIRKDFAFSIDMYVFQEPIVKLKAVKRITVHKHAIMIFINSKICNVSILKHYIKINRGVVERNPFIISCTVVL